MNLFHKKQSSISFHRWFKFVLFCSTFLDPVMFFLYIPFYFFLCSNVSMWWLFACSSMFPLKTPPPYSSRLSTRLNQQCQYCQQLEKSNRHYRSRRLSGRHFGSWIQDGGHAQTSLQGSVDVAYCMSRWQINLLSIYYIITVLTDNKQFCN